LLPGKFVDHTHADAVLAVVDQDDSEPRVREIWGPDAIFVPYVMPGFVLAKRVFELGDAIQRSHVMVLDKHGIFTWGSTAKESYERMIAAVTRAEEYVAARGRRDVAIAAALDDAERRRRQVSLSPLVRGALERAADGQKLVLSWRDEPEIVELTLREDAEGQTQIGTATPDHVIRTKPFPLWLGDVPDAESDARTLVEERLGEFADFYTRYFEEHAAGRPLTRLDRLPRLLLARGLGVLCVGKTLAEARIAGDVYRNTAGVIRDACAVGQYRPVSLADLFDVEYWSLEQAKLARKKAPAGSLARHVAVVTGAARGIGRAVAERFLAAGAHVLLSDVDAPALYETVANLERTFGPAAEGFAADVTDPARVRTLMNAAIAAFGGIDVVVSNAGNAPSGQLHTDAGREALASSFHLNFDSHQTVAAEATRVLLAQGTGGCLLFNASKSAFNPGPDFGPYAVPKAAVVALMRQYAVDYGPRGIRSNAINADRIHTSIFSDDLVERRAKARGVTPDQYFTQNLLGRETTAQDVADGFCYLATANATTGCVLTIDGGNAAAFPR
jgi:rhamnose utilization protein RhaD (predicted bifunctional aldolase and dehydrogenase)/NAD(P)-dependent dehydrogenase (short-subunit alcohol dehydrogenase family)